MTEPLVVVTVDEGQTFGDPADAAERAATAAALQRHLSQHLTDGRWHDGCSYCLQRRSKGGTGVDPS